MKTKLFWREFRTKSELTELIQSKVDAQDFDVEFSDELISDLIADRHYYCKIQGLRPTLFKKTRDNRPYRFFGLFHQGWHSVSWKKSVAGELSRKSIISQALRLRIECQMAYLRSQRPQCERCKKGRTAEIHHDDPPFDAIVMETIGSVEEQLITSALKEFDWLKEEAFLFPEGHPLITIFDKRHAAARLIALCRECHNQTKKHHPPEPLLVQGELHL